MSQGEPPLSPPLGSSNTPPLNTPSSSWQLPPPTDPTVTFHFTKATPMGEASEGPGARAQTAGARLSSSGGGGGREDAGEGESGAQLFSGVEGRAAGVQGAGGEQGARGGGGNSQDDTRAGGAQAIAVGGRQDAGQGGKPTGRASGAATSAAPSSQASAASLFTEQFRLGQRGGGGFFTQQKQQLGPGATPSNSKQLSVKLPSALSFLGAHAAPRTPSQTPATSSSGPPLGLFGLVPPPIPSHNTSRSVDGPSSTPRPAAPARSTDQAPSQQLARGPTSALTGVQIHDQRQVNSQLSAARNGQGQLGAIGLNPASKKRAASAATVGGGSGGLGSSGEVGLPRGPGAARGSEGTPLPKKRKGDKTPVGGFEGIMASMTAYHNQAERKDVEIASLKSQLALREQDVERLQAEKSTLKQEVIGKVHSAISRMESTKKSMLDASTGIREATTQIASEVGSFGAFRDLREELDAAQGVIQKRYGDAAGTLSLERHEESKVAALRDLQAEVLQHQGVIDLLREQLATKTGETVEARDRIAQLEQSQAAHQLSLEEREQEHKEARAREEGIMSKRAEMQDQLDAALVRAAEREKGLEEKEQSLRRDLESALESKATSEAAVASLTVSNSRSEKEVGELNSFLQGLQSKFESLEVSKRQLQVECDELSNSARAEKVKHETEVHVHQRQSEEQSALTRRQQAELDELRPLSAQLAKVKLDVEVLERKLTSDAAVASDVLERERVISRDLKSDNEALRSRNEPLNAQLTAKDAQLVEEGRRLALLQGTVAKIEKALEESEERNKELASQNSNLSDQLRRAEVEVAALQQQLSHAQSADSGSTGRQGDQLSALNRQLSDVKAMNDALTREKADSAKEMAQLNDEVAKLRTEHKLVFDSKELAFAETRRLQTELVASNAARDLLTGCETELANLKESQATSLQKRARDTYQSCQETFGREKAQLSNDLKRANNKLEELTTRNQKLSTELAKFKNRPVIDPHVASSSPAVSSGRSEPQQDVDVDLGRPQAAPDSDGSSTSTGAGTLSAIDALDEEGAEDEIETFTFVNSDQHHKREHKRESAALVEVPVPGRKTRKSEATTTVAGAGSTTRKQRSLRSRTLDEDKNGAAMDDDEIEEVQVVEDVAAPRGRIRPPAKSTYSKRRGGGKEVKD